MTIGQCSERRWETIILSSECVRGQIDAGNWQFWAWGGKGNVHRQKEAAFR